MSQSDFVTRGQALVAAGQFQEAVKVCRLGLLGRPTTVEGRVVLGQALLALKRYDEVLAEMRVALELDHASLPAQLLRGEALLKKGDHHAALDVLARARPQAPKDPRLTQLLAEAERVAGKPRIGASHPSVDFLGSAGDSLTKHYPNHPSHRADEEDTSDHGDEDTGGSYTRPTTLAAPGSRKRPLPGAPDATPPPAVLAIGDRSGTVEVDPEQDGIELGGDDDFGDIAAPPSAGSRRRATKPSRPARIDVQSEARGHVIPASRPARAQPRSTHPQRPEADVSSVELLDDELVELEEPSRSARGGNGAGSAGGNGRGNGESPARRAPGPGTAVRNAVNRPSGPLDASDLLPQSGAHPAAGASPGQLAQAIAGQPHLMHVNPAVPQAQPPDPRSAIAAALPTHAAMPMPMPMPLAAPPASAPVLLPAASVAAAARPTVALTATQEQSAAVVDQLFANGNEPVGAPAWARATVVAGGPAHAAQPIAPAMPAAGPGFAPGFVPGVPGEPPPSGPIAALSEGSQSSGRALKTGMRKTRSRLQLVVWVLVGAVMIGGGVFAGFQIRAMRLGKQINAARQQAVALAKADTWQGWVGARDRLAGIAQAEDSLDNRAALARARAVLAFEFGDGFAEARTGVAQLAGKGGLDGELAAAYLALAQSDGAAARAAAERALALAPEDASALYVAGQAALLGGDARTAITQLKAALGKEQRAAHAVALARALAMTSAWDDALGALEQALRATPDHPGALVERGKLLAEAGRIAPGSKEGGELRVQLEKVVHEGSRPVAEQTRGVSPLQVALAYLALARVDFARADPNHQSDLKNALGVGVDDQRFGEEATETFLATGQVAAAGSLAQESLVKWPSSRRARMVVAQVAIAQGKPADALDALSKIGELDKFAPGLAARAQAKLAAGDLEAAKADFDAALHRSPKLEPALVGRAWIDLAAKDVDEARQRIEPHWRPGASSPALATAYAAILRATQDPTARDQARGILERVVAGAPSATVARAQLELARLHREVGDMRLARTAYEEASRGGAREARLETGLLQIEDRDPGGGRDTIDQLVKEAGDRATPALLLEAARARMLAGDHAGAVQLLDALDKQPNLVRWQYDRERGRLALRRGDLAGATQALTRALDGCEDDAETFLLAAEAAGADPAQAALADKLRQLAPKRLKGRSEASIVVAKLALAEGNNDDADKAYATAKTAQEKEHATPRRQAQVNFGRAVIWYNTKEDKRALSDLDLAISQDPSIYDAYLFKAELLREKDPKRAFELAGTAVAYNPDYLAGWEMFGTLAHGLKKRSELATAVARVGELAPNSEALRQLQSLR